MFFFNLSLPEFLALLGTVSSVVVTLYLLDRVRRKQTVATLRFFTALDRVPHYKHRRRLQQPWSLLLQILSLALLLLALAQVRLGSPDRYSRDHVLILDTSAWMSARAGQGRLIDQARASAKAYLKAIPANDRVMLVRADALATPATPFESDRRKLEQAIDQSQAGATVLNMDQALEFAQQAQKLHAQRSGEIVFAGAARIASDAAMATQLPSNLRLLALNGPKENIGLRKVGVRRSLTAPDVWEIYVSVKNYGAAAHSVPLMVQFGGAPAGTRRFELKPGAEENATFRYATRAAGWLDARLLTRDAFAADDRAVLELPARNALPVTVYSDKPDLLKPVFSAIPEVKPQFLPVTRYQPKSEARIVILDRFAPSAAPQADSIWIEPPAARSPISVRASEAKVKLTRWRSDHALGAGLHTKDLEIEKAEVFRIQREDIPIAEADSGPLIVGRPSTPKMVVFGFHPVDSSMKFELTTPLLFANILHWMAPEIFRTWEVTAGTVGTVNVQLESEADPSTITVITEDQKRLPFTVEGRNLRFFSGSPGIVRVLTGGREFVYSLTLPQAGDVVWQPSNVRQGVPRRLPFQPNSRDIWQWLALLGGLGILADWLLFGRTIRKPLKSVQPTRRMAWRKAS
jgi:von Willebrand factor type A domain/Aerotolerance regulator N-terminal